MNAAVVVPVKALTLAKQRLAPDLDEEMRGRLARWMADRVVLACAPWPVFVVCDDDDVAAWAAELGATIVTPDGSGLNRAVEAGLDAVSAAGFDHVVITHADLPLPSGITRVPRARAITLVPDDRRDGTNVLAFPTATRLTADYGAASFARHLAQASAVADTDGLMVEVRADPQLALDIDTPADLRHPRLRKVLPTWLPTNPDNPSIPA
ncbi:MAG: 2-phospho-L-lactate guanylyltransferase [Ilumatobacter sp.]